MKLYLSILILAIGAACEKFPAKRYSISIRNNSSQRLVCFLGDGYQNNSLYPDTILPTQKNIPDSVSKTISTTYLVYDGHTKINDLYKTIGRDTLSIYVFSTDTIKKYPWVTIREKYMVLQRYDLSFRDGEKRNWQIEYPYDSTKGKLKVWPK